VRFRLRVGIANADDRAARSGRRRARHPHLIPHTNGARVADDRLERRAAGKVFTLHSLLLYFLATVQPAVLRRVQRHLELAGAGAVKGPGPRPRVLPALEDCLAWLCEAAPMKQTTITIAHDIHRLRMVPSISSGLYQTFGDPAFSWRSALALRKAPRRAKALRHVCH
jgi:hypothetical protein